MSAIGDKRLAIQAAVQTVDGIIVALYGARVMPVGFVLETAPHLVPASFRDGSGNAGVTTAEFIGYLVVNLDNYAQDQLEAYAELVINAIENSGAGVVQEALPGVYTQDGGPMLPCYQMTIAVTLNA